MFTRLHRLILMAIGVMALGHSSALGGVFLASNDWDVTPIPLNSWVTSYYNSATATNLATGGNAGGFLQVEFAADPNPGSEFTIVRVDTDYLFAGDYDAGMWVTFDFWAPASTANSLQVYFASDSNPGYYWLYTLDVIATNTWVNYGASFNYGDGDWVGNDPGMTEEQFLADLESISWIGIQIERDTTNQEFYGIDNFMLWVPEPGEWLLIITAVLVCLWAERRRQRITREPAWVFQSSTGPPVPI